MKIYLVLLLVFFATAASAVSEEVYVESPTDTDSDGKPDRIYVSISRPSTDKKLSTIFSISPYALGGNDGPMHEVDVDLLPQDEKLKSFSPDVRKLFSNFTKTLKGYSRVPLFEGSKYAQISAHSLGTGRSSGCATVGDKNEILAAKAVIEWLNGKARAFDRDGKEVKADWANGKVGMTGTSYDGTLPIMVASTGVEGLKAIVPIAAISNWYDYYRANGLVVNPGGYIGEDADVLAYFIMRSGSCEKELDLITRTMGRENGDFTPFWQARNHLANVKNIKAATFIIHGQSDWNVKQKHAIQLWEALEGVVPRRMFLHKGGHGSTYNFNVPKKLQMWFDHFLEDEPNGITDGPQVEVELMDGSLMTQEEWPHEMAKTERFYLSGNTTLSSTASTSKSMKFVDSGKADRLEALASSATEKNEGRLVFLSSPYESGAVLTGTTHVNLELSVLNRRAANITVAIVEFDKNGRGKIITRGWADLQNYHSIVKGELLAAGKNYVLAFDLEPKQYKLASGSRIGVLVASTDYEYTLRPTPGTELQLTSGSQSFIDIQLNHR
jgi:X-Pro dipeptidyl-peptidase